MNQTHPIRRTTISFSLAVIVAILSLILQRPDSADDLNNNPIIEARVYPQDMQIMEP